MVRMYLDDLRIPKKSFDVIVRSFDEAVLYVKQYGIPNFISFDHDLGANKDGTILLSGYDFAKWLVIQDMDKVYTFPSNFTYNVHSANPVGKKNIESYLDGYFQHHK